MRAVGNILYGIAAGFAATVLVGAGAVALALVASWIYGAAGWEGGGELAFLIIYAGFAAAVIAGIIVCLRLWVRRLRNPSAP